MQREDSKGDTAALPKEISKNSAPFELHGDDKKNKSKNKNKNNKNTDPYYELGVFHGTRDGVGG